MAYAAFRAKDYVRSAAYFAELPSPGPEDLFHYALGTSRAGDYEKAAKLYTGLYKAFPQHKRGDQASYKVGYLSYDAGDLEKSIPLFREHLSRYPQSRHAAEADDPHTELLLLVHELGHHRSLLAGTYTPEASPSAEESYAEEIRAWELGRRILDDDGYQWWSAFDEE